MLTFDATEQINEVSRTTTRTRTTRTTTQVITRCFGHWPQTKIKMSNSQPLFLIFVFCTVNNFGKIADGRIRTRFS